MTKIIIVDYSLEIVIAIITNDYFEQIYAIVWSYMPYFHIIYIYKKRLKTLFLNFYCFSIALSLKCQLYIGLVSSLNKKGKMMHGIIMCYTKTKRKKRKNGLLKLYILFTIKQNILLYNLYDQGSRLTLESSGTRT